MHSGKRALLIQGRNQSGRQAVPSSRASDSDQSLGGIKQLSRFGIGLGSEISTDKIVGSRPDEAARRLAVAPPVRYACDGG